MLSPDDSRVEAPRIHATLRARISTDPTIYSGNSVEPSEYLPEGVIRFEDLRLDNADVRANQLESANVVDPAQDQDPQRDVDPPRVYAENQLSEADIERVYTDLGAPMVARWAAAAVHIQEGGADPIPDAVRNGAVEHFLRRAHEPPIPQPEPGKCSELHKWVCDFIDARDDDTSTEAKMAEKEAEVAAAATVAEAGQQADATVEMEEAPAAQESLAKPPKCFFCPLSHQALRDPVTASDGYTYERNFLSIQFSRNIYTSPMTRESLQPMFFPNRAIVDAMHDWVMAQNPPQEVE